MHPRNRNFTRQSPGSVNRSHDDSSTALAAVAFQDHLIRNLSLGDPLRPRRCLNKSKKKPAPQALVDTGLRRNEKKKEQPVEAREYVLDAKASPLTLAQRMGLVDVPEQPLTEKEWKDVKEKSNRRDDSKQPCVICKDDFGHQQQVLLSCSHVFHRACLEAFEGFTGKKTCPMCRKEQYQTRVIYEGAKHHTHQCATLIQATWKGYVVRSWYQKLRETVPPKDPLLRKKFYEEKFHQITERMVRSLDCHVNHFLQEIDQDLQASRYIFRQFDAAMTVVTDEQWDDIQLRAVERGDVDCPICLTALEEKGLVSEQFTSTSQQDQVAETPKSATKLQKQGARKNTGKPASHKKTASDSKSSPGLEAFPTKTPQHKLRTRLLLSCSHVFHKTCLEAFEELAVENRHHLCPVCRTAYQKKVL